MSRTQVSSHGNTPFSFGQFFMALLLKCVSKHARHVFFIASLHSQFSEYANHRRMALSKLNEAMRLAHREEALSFPEAMRGRVWDGTGLEEILTEQAVVKAANDEAVTLLARKVVDISPRWSRYGKLDEMIQDTADWIRSQRDHLLNAPMAA